MGQDKAYLPVEWAGASVSLWERQLAVLQAVAPERVVISGPRKRGYPASLEVLVDDWSDVGPLGGIATCLSRTGSALLLVLAIDLPQIQPGFLRKLLTRCEVGRGVVPVHQDRFEPLVAVYPAAALAVAIDQIATPDYVLQRFIDKLLEQRLVTGYDVELGDQKQFQNWNTPNDVWSSP